MKRRGPLVMATYGAAEWKVCARLATAARIVPIDSSDSFDSFECWAPLSCDAF